MTVHIALLRAANVGGHGKVRMGELRRLLEELDLTGGRSLLQSGNLVFRSESRSTRELESLLEREAERRLGLTTDFIVRTSEEWASVRRRNPFPAEAEQHPARLLVVFFKDAPEPSDATRLRGILPGPETVRVDGKHAYVDYPAGIGRSRLTLPWLEKRLGTRGTARNWNTVSKLGTIARE